MDAIYATLSSMSIDGLDDIYVLGSFCRHVTIHSQQRRAFNLVCALFKSGRLRAGSTVAVIGGGFAGLTAAAAAVQSGAQVKIFEKERVLLNLQTGNHTRYLHPNLYDWPNEGSEVTATDLPFLNWHAGLSSDVAKAVSDEWRQHFEPRCEVLLNREIRRVDRVGGRPTLVTIRPKVEWCDFDTIILAAGFGLERELEGLKLRSYWEDDALHQRVRKHKLNSVLITGCGDGGLVDTLRVLIDSFDHESFLTEFIAEASLADIKPELIRIEREAKSLADRGQASEHLLREYSKLPLPTEAMEKIAPRIDPDTSVTLNGSAIGPLDLRSAILNRYLIFLFMQMNSLEYLEGKITSVAPDGKGGGNVHFDTPGGKFESHFKEIVVRHGPESVVSRLLPETASRTLKLTMERQSDLTKEKNWGDFFPNLAPGAAALEYSREYLNDHMAEVAPSMGAARQVGSIGVVQDDATGEFLYEVSFLQNGDSHAADPPLPERVAGVRVRIKSGSPPLAPAGKRMIAPYAFARLLFCGAAIENNKVTSGNRSGTRSFETVGTLGCFVRLADGGVAALSTSHTLVGGGQGKPDDAIICPDYSKEFRVGALAKFTTFIPQKSGGLNPDLYYASADAAVVRLDSGVPYSQDFASEYKRHLPPSLRISGVGKPSLGLSVFKVGHATGLTFGQIRSVDLSVMVPFGWGAAAFKGAFEVAGEKFRSFAKAGDSGAAVIGLDGLVLGIIVATSSQTAIVLPIEPALKELQCDVIKYYELSGPGRDFAP